MLFTVLVNNHVGVGTVYPLISGVTMMMKHDRQQDPLVNLFSAMKLFFGNKYYYSVIL